MQDIQEDDEHITVVYEDALHRAAPLTVRSIVVVRFAQCIGTDATPQNSSTVSCGDNPTCSVTLQEPTPAPRRRRAVPSQVEQERQHRQLHYHQAPLEEGPLHDGSPPRSDGEAEQEAGPMRKRRGGDILGQLRTESSQLLPHTSSPSAQHQRPMSLAELKAEMQAGSATKRGWAHAPLSTCR